MDKCSPGTLHSKSPPLQSGANVPLFVLGLVYLFALGSTEPNTANTYEKVFWDICPYMQEIPMSTLATCVTVFPCPSVTVTETATITATVTNAASAIACTTTSVTAMQYFVITGFFTVLGSVPLYFSILAGAKLVGISVSYGAVFFGVLLGASSAVFFGMASTFATNAINLAWHMG